MKKKFLFMGIILVSIFMFSTSCASTNVTVNEVVTSKKEKYYKDDRDNPDLKDKSDGENSFYLTRTICENTFYSLIEGDTINPILENARKNYLYKVVDEKIIKVDKEGNVTALSSGSTKLRIFEDLIHRVSYIGYVDFTVGKKEKINYNCSENDLKEIDNRFEKYIGNDITLTTTIKFKDIESVNKVIARENPFYKETIVEDINNPKHTIIKYENDKYYIHYLDDLSETVKKREMINYNPKNILNLVYDSSSFNYNKIEFKKINDNKYEMRFYVLDLLNNDLLEGLDEALKKNALCKMNIEFKDNMVDMSMKTTIRTTINNKIENLTYEISYNFIFDQIEEFDMSTYTLVR